MANLHLLINFTCYNNYLQIKSQEFSPSLNISCGIHVLCVCVCAVGLLRRRWGLKPPTLPRYVHTYMYSMYMYVHEYMYTHIASFL